MTDDTIVCVSQERDTPVTAEQRRSFGYRYAYSRSADSQAHHDKGQDYLTFHENGKKLVFALCDGVSQSFYGDLAAHLLGDALAYWLWEKNLAKPEILQKGLEEFLDSLVEPASKQVETYPIPSNLAPMIQQVLEQKRAVGSESTFVAGLFDLAAGQLFLAWMGDSRLRLWGPDGEITDQLGDTLHTQERWSTRRGRIGDLHAITMSLSKLRYLIAYSDGLARLDKIMVRHFRDSSIDAVIEDSLLRPESDDISFFEVWAGNQRPLERPPLPAPLDVKLEIEEGRARVRWRPVAGAAFYEVRLADEQVFNVYAPSRSFDVPRDALRPDARSVRVRTWDQEPGDWSVELPIPQGLLQLVVPPRPPEAIPVPQPRPQPAAPTPVPFPAPTVPPPVHPRPTPTPPSPVPARPSWLLPFLSGGLAILVVGCLVGMLVFWPRSPFHAKFFPLPTPVPSPTIHRRMPIPFSTQAPVAPPFVPLTETEIPTEILPSSTPSPTGTFTSTIEPIFPATPTPITVRLCTSKDEADVLESPTFQRTVRKLSRDACLAFDAWMEYPKHLGWFRIAPGQKEYLELAGKWIMGDRLKLPEDESWRTSLPQITLTPIPSPTLTPGQPPLPTLTPGQPSSPSATP